MSARKRELCVAEFVDMATSRRSGPCYCSQLNVLFALFSINNFNLCSDKIYGSRDYERGPNTSVVV